MLDRLRGWLARALPRSDGDGRRAGDGNDGDAGSIWDLTPSWQYGGRLHGGGLSRGRQEDAIREVQEQAAERARGERDRPG